SSHFPLQTDTSQIFSTLNCNTIFVFVNLFYEILCIFNNSSAIISKTGKIISLFLQQTVFIQAHLLLLLFSGGKNFSEQPSHQRTTEKDLPAKRHRKITHQCLQPYRQKFLPGKFKDQRSPEA